MKRIDDFLNGITMYRLALYYLIFLHGAAVLFSLLGLLKYDVIALLFSLAFLLMVCWGTNKLFAWVFRVPANVESVYISALLLALMIDPIRSLDDLWFLGWAAVLAMASKYIVAVNHKHIFNPVIFAVTLTYFAVNQSASWWVGNAPMLPLVLLGGLLLVRKLGRFDLVFSFLLAAFGVTVAVNIFNLSNLPGDLQKTLLYSPTLFFAFIILTEPLTMPPTRSLRILYGVLTGVLAAPQFHIGSFYMTPELAMMTGNVFSYMVSPNTRVVLTLKEKIRLAPDIYDFVFTSSRRFAYAPGQFMEWTLGHPDTDDRGNRRYFTLASGPQENNIRMGVKFYAKSSSYKKALLTMNQGDEIIAAQVAGDFVLPSDRRQKCVFIAGGVGVTPFRSMIRYLLDNHQKRPITLFYANKTVSEIIYKDIFDRAEQELGIRTIYTLSDSATVPAGWRGNIGRIDAQLIQRVVPDYQQCLFYISGPNNMVESFRTILKQMKVPAMQIKTDYFPGF
jgi:ferredoxin-NADP reductase